MGMFDTNKKVATVKTSAKDKVKKVEVAGLDFLSVLIQAKKSLEALISTAESKVKGNMTNYFVAEGTRLKARPVNFRGTENDASASCELKIRSKSSPLTQDEIDLLDEHKIGHSTITLVADTFVINPAYANDMAMLERMEKLMAKAMQKGDLPADLFLKQDGQQKEVIDDNALDTLFAIEDEATIRALLPVCGVLSVKTTREEDNFKQNLTAISTAVAEAKIELANA